MKTIISFFLFVFTFLNIQAQTEDAWVYFTDKPNAATYFSNPSLMLSQRALNRRTSQNIALDLKDVPLYQNYITQIKNATGITIKAQSKWLNCVHVQGTQTNISALNSLGFVASIDFASSSITTRLSKPVLAKKNQNKFQESYTDFNYGSAANQITMMHGDFLHQNNRLSEPVLAKKNQNKFQESYTDFNYGSAANQITMMHGDFLHQNNYTGTGMQIAVIDAGFINVNTMGAFSSIRNNGQILGTYNFVDRISDVYTRNYHGTMVLSTIAGFVQDQYVGTAPDASFYLFLTEDVSQEHPYEESLWVEAAERADSLGVDVLNTSLGYTVFDRAVYNHTYNEMDGNTTFITRGAEIAFSRGMLVVNSAGNEGSSSWHYIGAPADGPSVLSIGAVDASGIIASFSSWGPNADEKTKPDVCAQGSGSAVINTNNVIQNANGTSFSGPILAGAATCFWQAFPDKTNVQIAHAIRQSSHLYANPNDHYGYGIPNFQTAFSTLNRIDLTSNIFSIFPNPINNSENLTIRIMEKQSNMKLNITDMSGKLVRTYSLSTLENNLNLHSINKGIYILTFQSDSIKSSQKLIIQ